MLALATRMTLGLKESEGIDRVYCMVLCFVPRVIRQLRRVSSTRTVWSLRSFLVGSEGVVA